MKKLLIFTSLFILAGCGKSDKPSEVEQAKEKVEQAKEKVEQAKDSLASTKIVEQKTLTVLNSVDYSPPDKIKAEQELPKVREKVKEAEKALKEAEKALKEAEKAFNRAIGA